MTADSLSAEPWHAEHVPNVAELADPSAWAAHIAQAIVDTLFGTRPIQQLLRWTDAAVYHALVTALSDNSPAPGAPRPAVRRIRISTPAAKVAEVSVLIQMGLRYRAAAMRLEVVGPHWRCTAFDLL